MVRNPVVTRACRWNTRLGVVEQLPPVHRRRIFRLSYSEEPGGDLEAGKEVRHPVTHLSMSFGQHGIYKCTMTAAPLVTSTSCTSGSCTSDLEKDANGANAVCGKFSESGGVLGEIHSTYSKF